jgi:pyridoxamine 5'-phosphate oxidase
MTDRSGIFAGDDPFQLAREWMAEARLHEVNDPDAAALATVDADGMPNVRVVLMRHIEDAGFVFYTNYTSAKGTELLGAGKAAFVIHWKSLRRQIRVRGTVSQENGPMADSYFASRASLEAELAAQRAKFGDNAPRPPFWGGFRIAPIAIEFWADGADRLHDRFLWTKAASGDQWAVTRLNP